MKAAVPQREKSRLSQNFSAPQHTTTDDWRHLYPLLANIDNYNYAVGNPCEVIREVGGWLIPQYRTNNLGILKDVRVKRIKKEAHRER